MGLIFLKRFNVCAHACHPPYSGGTAPEGIGGALSSFQNRHWGLLAGVPYTHARRVVDQTIVDVGTGQGHGGKCCMVRKKRQLILTGMSEDEVWQALLQEFPDSQPLASIVEDEDG